MKGLIDIMNGNRKLFVRGSRGQRKPERAKRRASIEKVKGWMQKDGASGSVSAGKWWPEWRTVFTL